MNIKQLTSSDSLESQHTYYDISPWSHDGSQIVYSSVPTEGDWSDFGHDTLACREGKVNVIDVATGGHREVADGVVYLKHGGAFCMWHPKRADVIYFRQNNECFARLDLETGKKNLLSGRIRQQSPDGTEFAILMDTPHSGGQGEAIGIMSEDGSEIRRLVDREQLYGLTPNRDKFRPEDMLLGNTKWHPDGQHLLMTMWIYSCPGVRRSLYVASRDGSRVWWLSYFAHHHSWTPDGSKVLFNDRVIGTDGRGVPRMCLVDFDGSNHRVAFDEPIGSHPIMHPDGSRILDSDDKGIYVAHLDNGEIERLATFGRSFPGTHHGTHPHPVWSRDGSRIIYNSAETGHSELYEITLED